MIKSRIYYFIAVFFTFSFFANAENISFSANSMTGSIGDNADSSTLQGEAYVLTETMEISADKISMSGKNFRYIQAEGTVSGKNLKSNLEFSCQKLSYDRETKIARLSEEVFLKDIKNEVSANAQMIEYNQETDIAVMQVQVELKQKDNTCTGAFAVYDKKQQTLDLSGNAKIKQGDDTFQAQVITLNLDTQEISLDGRVKGSIVDENKKSTEENNESEEKDESKEESIDSEEKTDESKENSELNPKELNKKDIETKESNSDSSEKNDSEKKDTLKVQKTKTTSQGENQ